MKHNIIPKALRWMAAAGLCLAAAACSKDDITPEPAPQQGITPTKIIFNVTRGGYDGDAETRAPKSGWAEGDVIYFRTGSAATNLATYTDGEWVVTMNSTIANGATYIKARYAEKVTDDAYGHLSIEHGDVAYTTSGSYKVDEGGVATITLRLDQHPQGRMTFTGVGKGKELTVLGMKYVSYFRGDEFLPRYTEAPITLTGEDDGTATLYALPTPPIVTEAGITLTVTYDGVVYTKTFAGKEFKENSNITLAAPSLEGGWAEAVTEYAAADLKMGDYLYSDGTTSDGGLRKLLGRKGDAGTADHEANAERIQDDQHLVELHGGLAILELDKEAAADAAADRRIRLRHAQTLARKTNQCANLGCIVHADASGAPDVSHGDVRRSCFVVAFCHSLFPLLPPSPSFRVFATVTCEIFSR